MKAQERFNVRSAKETRVRPLVNVSRSGVATKAKISVRLMESPAEVARCLKVTMSVEEARELAARLVEVADTGRKMERGNWAPGAAKAARSSKDDELAALREFARMVRGSVGGKIGEEAARVCELAENEEARR